jgi:uridine kinase
MITNTPYFISVCGASGSGKSLFTHNLQAHLNTTNPSHSVLILQEDHYYRAQDDKPMDERIITNYDHPDAFEHTLLQNHLQSLKAGQCIDYPQYCFKTHTRQPECTTIAPAPIIIVEGIMVMAAPELQDIFDLRLFVDTPIDICLLRRMQRDINERGRTVDCVANQYQATVKPMYHQFIAPTKHRADMIINHGGHNTAALHVVAHHVQSVLDNDIEQH